MTFRRLFPKKPEPTPSEATTSGFTPWRVVEWSKAQARGIIRDATGKTLNVDASHCTVADLHIGEEVVVAIDAKTGRIVQVEPRTVTPRQPAFMAPHFSITSAPLLDCRLDDDTQRRELEDRLFEEAEIPLIERAHGFVTLDGFSSTPEQRTVLQAFLERELGRSLEPLIHVQGEYPFDWRQGDVERLGNLMRHLPGFDEGDGAVSFFGADAAAVPTLWISVEPIGLMVGGTLRRAQWDAWRSAFERTCLPAFQLRRLD